MDTKHEYEVQLRCVCCFSNHVTNVLTCQKKGCKIYFVWQECSEARFLRSEVGIENVELQRRKKRLCDYHSIGGDAFNNPKILQPKRTFSTICNCRRCRMLIVAVLCSFVSHLLHLAAHIFGQSCKRTPSIEYFEY